MDTNKDQAKTLTIEEVIKGKLAVYMREKSIVQQLFNIEESEVLEPFTYLWNLGGKKVRIIAALLIQDLFDAKIDEKVIKIGGLTELLHCATLIIDDIQDSSIERRGKPCSHIIYGVDTAINAANLIYFLPAQKLIGTLTSSFEEKWKLNEIYMNALVEGHIGQGLDLQCHKAEKKEDLPSCEEYIKFVGQKTGGLMKMMVGMLGIVLKLDEEAIALITECMNFIGISFQITDDILNIQNCMGKGIIAEDLHQRKFTLIVDQLRQNQEFMDLYFLKVKNQEVIHKLIAIINSNSVLQKCRAKAETYSSKAFQCLNSLKCPGDKQAFRLFIKFVVQRKN